MKLNKYTIDNTTEAVDLISYTLSELGIEGIEIEDKVPLSEADKEIMYVDILPQEEPDDGKAKVSFYIDPEEDTPEKIRDIMKAVYELSDFVDIGEFNITKTETADTDWMNNWKQYWKPFRVDEHIIIKPTWEELTDAGEDDIVAEIDPGSAFGTGTHHTTQLCIRGMKPYLKSDTRLLDVGCGSGILSIIAMLMGIKSAKAIDIDVHAADTARENAQVNHIDPEKYEVIAGDLITDSALAEKIGNDYDVVVANILAEVIIELNKVIGKCMKKGTVYVTSGILDTKEDQVKESLEAHGFKVTDVAHSGEWIAITSVYEG